MMNKESETYAPQYRRRSSGAFTIVEIMVVVVIIAALATMIAPKFFGQIGKTKHTVAEQKLKTLESVVDAFYLSYDRLPERLEDVVVRPADIAEEQWDVPAIKSKDLLDPWGNTYIYKMPGEHGMYDLYTLGKDGQPGGEHENADISNWE